jgi:hypothetical protein
MNINKAHEMTITITMKRVRKINLLLNVFVLGVTVSFNSLFSVLFKRVGVIFSFLVLML